MDTDHYLEVKLSASSGTDLKHKISMKKIISRIYQTLITWHALVSSVYTAYISHISTGILAECDLFGPGVTELALSTEIPARDRDVHVRIVGPKAGDYMYGPCLVLQNTVRKIKNDSEHFCVSTHSALVTPQVVVCK